MKRKLILALSISLGLFSACETGNQKIEFDGVGDIYVRCQKIDNVTKYAPVIKAYGNMSMKRATMVHTDDESQEVILEKQSERATNFISYPSKKDFTTTDVKNGTYKFTLTQIGGKVLNLSDKLLKFRLDPIEINTFDYKKTDHKFDITWNTVENRDIYHVKITTAIDGDLVYKSQRLNNNAITITPLSTGWSPNYTMKKGTTYVISVSAYKFEDSNRQNSYHINQQSIEYRSFEW